MPYAKEKFFVFFQPTSFPAWLSGKKNGFTVSPILWRKGFMIHEITWMNITCFFTKMIVQPFRHWCWFISQHNGLRSGWISSRKVSLCQFCKVMAGSGSPACHTTALFVNSWWCACKIQSITFPYTLMMHFWLFHFCCNLAICFFSLAISYPYLKARSPSCQIFWKAAAHRE